LISNAAGAMALNAHTLCYGMLPGRQTLPANIKIAQAFHAFIREVSRAIPAEMECDEEAIRKLATSSLSRHSQMTRE
jgi:hypothetical protein